MPKGAGRVIMKKPLGSSKNDMMGDMKTAMEEMQNEMAGEDMKMMIIPDDRSVSQRSHVGGSNASSATWTTIWPNYIDSTKTVSKGRKLPAHLAIPSPTLEDIYWSLRQMGMRFEVYPYKFYPRDPECKWFNPGNIKVEVKNERGGYVHPEVESKLDLLKVVARTAVGNKGRGVRLEVERRKKEKKDEEERVRIEELSKVVVLKSAVTATVAGGKKGKGKKRNR